MRDEDSYFDAAARLSEELALGDPHRRGSERDWRIVENELIGFLFNRFRDSLSNEDVLDAVQATILNCLAHYDPEGAERAGRKLRPFPEAGKWFFKTAKFRAIDILRKRSREVAEEFDDPIEEDGTIRFIERTGTLDEYQAAYDLAIERGDWVVVRVVRAWLDLHRRGDDDPSTRAVGDRVAMSHTTVADALHRFGVYLDEIRGL